ncbi:MAG: ATP-binding cassette domain-containing protein [Aggregatilineales bacterium]
MILDLLRDSNGRRLIVPEVVQTSAMDCGPATLKAILEGFDIRANYGRLREACQTTVDGTSIDVIQDIANQLGLDATQIILPADHLLLDDMENFPAIVVTRQPNGITHFIVVWNKNARFVQIMDPAIGRRWISHKHFMEQVYIHTMPLDATVWRNWAGSDGYLDPLRARLQNISITQSQYEPLMTQALNDTSWFSLAAFDACTRMVTAMVAAEGVLHGDEAAGVLKNLFNHALDNPTGIFQMVNPNYWFAAPADFSQGMSEQENVMVRGSVLVRVSGKQPQSTMNPDDDSPDDTHQLSPELRAALEEKTEAPERVILRYLQWDGLLIPAFAGFSLLIEGLAILIQILILRGLIDAAFTLPSFEERLGLFGAIFLFFALQLLIEYPQNLIIQRIARRFEFRLRIAFLEKIPKLSDRYFHSRLTSDMVQRAHSLSQLRSLPFMLANTTGTVIRLLLTAIAVVWLEPGMIILVILAVTISAASMLITQPILSERNLRMQTHIGALSNFYLDAMLGLLPIRTHGAERAVRREHEGRLVEWFHASQEFFNITILVQAVEAFIGWFFASWILLSYANGNGSAGGALLLAYWALQIPSLSQRVAGQLKQYPRFRNMLLRLIEPLSTPEENDTRRMVTDATPLTDAIDDANPSGVQIIMQDVTVQAGGHRILSDINLTINPGEHVAVVGVSGAGKSSLAGLLLGWHSPAAGHVWIDGERLQGEKITQLRQQIAWIDPDVQLWNRSFLENLQYGIYESSNTLGDVLESANLTDVLRRLEEGLQTKLGEGGGLVSGGEGQRVRLGRGLMRDKTRLIIMDEPFRGLDRPQRRDLMQRVREIWHDTTLISITHDVSETVNYQRVLVVEDGQIVEDGNPAQLSKNPASRYKQLLDADYAVNEGLWQRDIWRRLWLEDGQLTERDTDTPDDTD